MAIATLRGYCSQDPDENAHIRMSGFVVAEVLLKLYDKFKLFPDGLTAKNPLAQKWAVKTGHACRKLAAKLHVLSWHVCLIHACLCGACGVSCVWRSLWLRPASSGFS